jgi:transketolase
MTGIPLPDAQLPEMAARIRRHVVTMFKVSGHGHFGGSLSCVDIVTALYFGGVLSVRSGEPDWTDRDRFIISKGHGAPAVYGALCERGFFPEGWIHKYETLGANLSTHPNMRTIPGIDMSSGALGHGLSNGVGMALASRLDAKSYRVVVLLGDGECLEGSVWEAAMAAAKYRLGGLIAIVDRNGLCVGGPTESVMPLEPLADKWRAFGWAVCEADGHDIGALVPVFRALMAADSDQPTVVLARTIKGRGVSFMENRREWHGHPISDEQYRLAMQELGGV